MKQVVIIDETPLFREYLRIKLTDNDIEASVAINGLDGLTKIRNITPDLVIMDYELSRQGCMEVLKQKKASPTLAPIPVIVLSRQFDQKRIIELAAFNVKKVFTKPVKIETLFATMADLLQVTFEIDTSPGIVEVHVNDDIIFVEVTEGLNRDKIDLLRFKITELMELYEIRVPKIIIIIRSINLSISDIPNILKLFKAILESSSARPRNVKVLTRESFIGDFINGQKEFRDIEVVNNLQEAMDRLALLGPEGGEKQAVLLGEKLLAARSPEGETMMLRFDGDVKAGLDEIKDSLKDLSIAVVDDDEIIREMVRATFSGFEIELKAYADGAEYIEALGKEHFDLVFLDILMPRADGFAVLREIQDKNIKIPVIILSTINQRDTVIRAFQMGVKSYLTKPLRPEGIFKKTLEILRVNF